MGYWIMRHGYTAACYLGLEGMPGELEHGIPTKLADAQSRFPPLPSLRSADNPASEQQSANSSF